MLKPLRTTMLLLVGCLLSACASEPPKLQSVGLVVVAPKAPRLTPLALPAPPEKSFSFQTALQEIFDRSLGKQTESSTPTAPATTTKTGK